MGTSPKDNPKKGASKSPVQANASVPQSGTDQTSVKQDDTVKAETTKAEPLAPPPRPTDAPVAGSPDYFNAVPPASNLATEANPFEYSFAGGQSLNGGDQTPGGTKLPSVAAITSPAGILGPSSYSGIWGSLRSGPLSPAMLSGPAKDDYFGDGHHLRGGFPTPNESGMRSGLTPGGGGSMFPDVQTPNTAALFGQLQSAAATPTTIDFHRTAMAAAARNQKDMQQQPMTSQPQEMMNGMDVKPTMPGPQFDGQDANDAANGLFLLAQSRNQQPQNHYAMAPIGNVHSHPQPTINMGGMSQNASPTMAKRNNGSISTTSGRGVSEISDDEQQTRPNTRGKGKRNSAQISQSNGRQKEAPSKAPKKAKANNGYTMEPEPVQSEEEQDMSKDEYNANGKKMTDEEKRKNFLERNRVAALKCRQRKKQWLANLQQKVEIFSTENDALSQQISALRDEVVNLKTLLLAHKDCPVSAQQGHGQIMHQIQMNGFDQQMNHNPYGMAAMGQVPMNGQGQPMYRRSS